MIQSGQNFAVKLLRRSKICQFIQSYCGGRFHGERSHRGREGYQPRSNCFDNFLDMGHSRTGKI